MEGLLGGSPSVTGGDRGLPAGALPVNYSSIYHSSEREKTTTFIALNSLLL